MGCRKKGETSQRAQHFEELVDDASCICEGVGVLLGEGVGGGCWAVGGECGCMCVYMRMYVYIDVHRGGVDNLMHI